MQANKDQDLVWLIDDEFDSYEIERGMLDRKGYRLVVSRGAKYRSDYEKYAARARALIVWIGHFIGAQDIQGLHNCIVISVRGGGYNNIDIEAAARHGIAVTYVPALQAVFGTVAVPLPEGLGIVATGFAFLLALEAEKSLRLRRAG